MKISAANTEKCFLIMLNNQLQKYLKRKKKSNSKRIIKKTAEGTGDLISNITADKNTCTASQINPETD